MPDARPSIRHLALKLAARTRARGPGEVARLGWERARATISSRGGLIVLARPAGGEAPVKEGYIVRLATPDDAVLYVRDIGTDSVRTFRARLSDATRCFVVEHSNRFLHASWVTTAGAWTREVHRYFKPPSGDAYTYESFTRADARGRGLYPYALEHIAASLGREEVRRLWVAVEDDNDASLRAVTKAGFSEVFRIDYRRRLGRLEVADPTGEPGHPCAGCLARTI